MRIHSILVCAAINLFSATGLMACTLSMGVVPQFEHRRTLETWDPILERLQDATGCKINFEGAHSIPEFEASFKSGLYDLAYMNPFHLVQAHDAQGYLPLVRSGSSQLQGILTVAGSSDFETLEDLEGHEIAFPAPNALGASLLMRAELATLHNLSFVPKYVGTHTSVYLNVFKDLASAGGGVQRTLNSQDSRLQDGLRVIYRTEKVPSHPLAVHPRVEDRVKLAIVSEMMAIDASQPDLLESVPMKSPVPAKLEDYAALRELGLEDFVD